MSTEADRWPYFGLVRRIGGAEAASVGSEITYGRHIAVPRAIWMQEDDIDLSGSSLGRRSGVANGSGSGLPAAPPISSPLGIFRTGTLANAANHFSLAGLSF